ncbi:hypothetical protein Glove_302g68 [Diversispora epigaea]|uniref:Uncharacterized protein n=1 Tax=Diversispora epigaea TaxID=1348612 RepID=A0A397I2Z1_9GLOM|nr:hypothetical protein Glove_302g68 [Diversispora epigaea]
MNNLEQKIQKLERWLKESEKHIAYLENQIGIRDESIILLKTEVGNLKPRLKKALQDIENKDKIIPALESQLIEMTSEISSLRYRIQKLRETMALDMRHLPSTNTPVFNLIIEMRANIKILGDSVRGDNTLLRDEIDNLQTQTELKLTKIQNGCYTFENEVTQLRQEVINLKDINRNQQELTNELGALNKTLKEQIDDLTDKNETIQSEINEKTRLYDQAQDRLDECREENYQLRESLQGAHENITESDIFTITYKNMNNLEQKIQKLERWLKESEKHIAYLENQIGIRDESIILLKTEVGNLKPRLKKALQDIENKDKIIPALESQLIEMTSEISSLRYRIQKLRETMALDMRHLPSTNTPVFNLIIEMRANIKILGDSARGDNTLLRDEIDNLQTQTELKLTKIQNGCYTFENEVTQLRQEVINLKDINRNQQELTNELGALNKTLKEQIDDLTDKNETIQSEINEKTRLYDQAQDRLDECREENYQLRESLQGAHENITESESTYDKLKQKLRILGLTHVAWRARNLRQAQILDIEFNTARTAWRNQRNRNQHITRELQNCRSHGRNLQNDKVLIEFWRDRIILRYEKWKNKTHGA